MRGRWFLLLVLSVVFPAEGPRAAPPFPIHLVGHECWRSIYGYSDVCVANQWVLVSNGTFSDIYGGRGTWSYGAGILRMGYDGSWHGYEYRGFRSRACVGGSGRSQIVNHGGPHEGDSWLGCVDR